MTQGNPASAIWPSLRLFLLTLLVSGQIHSYGQADDSNWQRDAGAVARSHVSGMINSGAGNRASLVGYQRGLGVPLIAIYNYEGYTTGGFLKRTMLSVAMQRDPQGNWYVVAAEEGGVFEGLPLRQDWRQVAQDGGRAREVQRRGY